MKKIVCTLLVLASLATGALEAEARTRRPLFPRLNARLSKSANCSSGSCSSGRCASGACSIGAAGSAEVPAAVVVAPPGPAAAENSVATTKSTVKELAAPPAP